MQTLLIVLCCALAAAVLALCLLLPALIRRAADKRAAACQMQLMEQHIAEVRNLYAQMRGWRHDYHNHIQTLQAYVSLAQYDRIAPYLKELCGDLDGIDTLVKSGNVTVDAILSSKLSLLKSRGVAVHAKASAPERLTVSETDLCAVLGNLLDNADEACVKLTDPQQRFVRLYLGTLKGQLYLNVTNACRGRPRPVAGRYLTAKPGMHGLGLARVDRIVHKYGGSVNRQSEEGVFATEILLPL